MIKLPEFIKNKAEQAIHTALNPKGMHTNGPCMASIEVTHLQRLLLTALSVEQAYEEGYNAGVMDESDSSNVDMPHTGEYDV